ncbi:hypothetical protein GCM10028794_20760 [Silanimonas algicola]
MPTPLGSRRIVSSRSIAALVAAMGLVGCSGADSPPEGWAAPEPASDTAGGCPDLRGLYAFTAGDGSRFGWRQTPLLGAWRIEPQALEIVANDREQLRARWVFTPAQVDRQAIALRDRDRRAFDLWQRLLRTDAPAEGIVRDGEARDWERIAMQGPVPYRSKTLRGVEGFLCEDGWLVLLQHAEHGGGAAMPPRRVALARDASGGLVARLDEVRDSAIPLWAGDGVPSIPLGGQTYRDWARWPAHPPIPAWAPDWTVLGGLDERFVLPAAEAVAQSAIGERDAAGRPNPFAVRERASGLPAAPWQQLAARIGALADTQRTITTITLESRRLRVEGRTTSNTDTHALMAAIAALPGAGEAELRQVRMEGDGVGFVIGVGVDDAPR